MAIRPGSHLRNPQRDPRTAKVATSVSSWLNFTPASLSPTLWLDAADTATITESSGAVSQWNDKSGNSYHLSQGTGANQPATGTVTQNGRNVIGFSADNKFLTHDAGSNVISLSPMTMFCVVYDNNSTQGALTFKRIFTTRISNSTNDFQSPNFLSTKNNTAREFGIRSRGLVPTPEYIAYTDQKWFVGTAYTSSSGGFHQVNDSSRSVSTSNLSIDTSRFLRVGQACSTGAFPATIAGNGWIGYMAEILVFNKQLTESEISTVKNYLFGKWGPF